jgi:hypothetical protein
MREAMRDRRIGRPTGGWLAWTETVTAPAHTPFGHQTGADTQQMPGTAS